MNKSIKNNMKTQIFKHKTTIRENRLKRTDTNHRRNGVRNVSHILIPHSGMKNKHMECIFNRQSQFSRGQTKSASHMVMRVVESARRTPLYRIAPSTDSVFSTRPSVVSQIGICGNIVFSAC